ncbi:ankyrin repeat-containing domain protein [Coniochaeta sp. 2T2.1]|nr:ankyrin repeat-containing domain protein [Coniochaeta sp. 2T2.1]
MDPTSTKSTKPCVALGLNRPATITDLPIEVLENIAGHLVQLGVGADRTNFMRTHSMIRHKLVEYLLFDAVQNARPRTIVGAVANGRLDLLKAFHSKGLRLDTRYGTNSYDRYDPSQYLKYRRSRITFLEPDSDVQMPQSLQPLHLAVVLHHENIVSWLVEEIGVPLNEPCKELHLFRDLSGAPAGDRLPTPLNLAMSLGDLTMVEALLKKGATLYNDFTTPLHLAVTQRGCSRLDMVKLVLKHLPGDIDAINLGGMSALGTAVDKRTTDQYREECVRLLLEAGASLTVESRFDAIPEHQLRLADPGLDDGAIVQLLPLHIAVMSDNYEVVLALLEAGADLNSVSEGHTALHCAFRNTSLPGEYLNNFNHYNTDTQSHDPRLDIIEALLEAGADPNSEVAEVPLRTSAGLIGKMTPIMYAARATPDPKILELLLRHGADVNAVDSNGQTALHWLIAPLVTGDARELVVTPYADRLGPAMEVLLKHGCDPTVKNSNGQCAMELAANTMHGNHYNPMSPVFCGEDTLIRLLLDSLDGKSCCAENRCLTIALKRCLTCYHEDCSNHGCRAAYQPGCYRTALSLMAAGAVLSEDLVRRVCRKFLTIFRTPNEEQLRDLMYAKHEYRKDGDPFGNTIWALGTQQIWFDRVKKLAAANRLLEKPRLAVFFHHQSLARKEGLQAIDRMTVEYEKDQEYYDSNDGTFHPEPEYEPDPLEEEEREMWDREYLSIESEEYQAMLDEASAEEQDHQAADEEEKTDC